jgi:hypothetical protein
MRGLLDRGTAAPPEGDTVIRNHRPARRLALLLAVLAAAGSMVACSSDAESKGSSGSKDLDSVEEGELVGLFRLDAGTFEDGELGGTWFRMLQPGADPEEGPYMENGDSPADGGQATLLTPGTSGGLRSGGYQSEPVPGFDGAGNSVSDAITLPTKWFGVAFSISTNPVDPQTETEVPPPTVILEDGELTADLSSWAASWNNQEFNQGAPKPVRSTGAKAPGQEQAEKVWDWVAGKYLEAAPRSTSTGSGAKGTYDRKTGRFTLEWTSYIEGGAFNGFTGLWHLEGTFEPSGRAPDEAK